MNVEAKIAEIIADKSERARCSIQEVQNNASRRVKEYLDELRDLPATARRDVELAARVEAAGFEVRFRTYMNGFSVRTEKDRLLALSRVLGSFKVECRGLTDYTDQFCNTVEVELKPRRYPFVAVYYTTELPPEEQEKPGRCKIVTEVRTTRSLVCSV